MRQANICINLNIKNINNVYTYNIPDEFNYIDVGWRVIVPFGNQICEGFVLELLPVTAIVDVDKLKSVMEVLDSEAWFSPDMITLARELKDYYLCNLVDIMRLFIPGKSGLKINLEYVLSDNALAKDFVTVEEQEIYNYLLEKKSAQLLELKKILSIENLAKILSRLLRKNLLLIKREYKKNYQEKTVTIISLAEKFDLSTVVIPKQAQSQQKLINLLRENPNGLELSEVIKQHNINRGSINTLRDKNFVVSREEKIYRDSYKDACQTSVRVTLNAEQSAAITKINLATENQLAKTFLLQGITGSGKTEVYLQAACTAVGLNKQVLVLVPEIALTQQIIQRFKAQFADSVVVAHSRLSQNERTDVYAKVRAATAKVLIGVRSAIFAPFVNLGLIIIDEEHEFTYKQEEYPGYHARTVAEKISIINSLPIVLGSATPALESYYKAKNKIYDHLILSERIGSAILPEISIVSMSEELHKGNKTVISEKLHEALAETFAKGEQAIILLNRRGYSTIVLCRDCGYVEKCPHCDVSLVFHRKGVKMSCHYCGYKKEVVDVCPSCGSHRIKFLGTGTQKLEEVLLEQFPTIKILRLDQDTTSKKFSHVKILNEFRANKYNLLIGTQIVAKGHDIENVTMVGVLLADSMLNIPDYRSSERCFALLTQAAGRAGRGVKVGKAIFQAYDADNLVIQATKTQDYDSFAERELISRKDLFLPPYSNVIKINITDTEETKTLGLANSLTEQLKKLAEQENKIIVIGPYAAMVKKVNNIYRYNILIKATDIEPVKQFLQQTNFTNRGHVFINVDPLSVV